MNRDARGGVPPPLIVSLGEILVDFLPVPGAEGPVFAAHAGGAPTNVAVAAARLGGRAAFAGKVSRDRFGRFLRAHLAAEGVDLRFLPDDDAPSTLAFVEDTPSGPAFSFYGADAADTRLRTDELPPALFEEAAVFHFGGISLLRGTTPDAALAAAERLKGRALLSFDPNVRPALVADEAAYRARADRALALADVVKLSVQDLGWLAPGQSPDDYAQNMLRGGATLVAVTDGERGSTLFRPGERLVVPPRLVEVIDTVGAGDAFAAALLVALVDIEVTTARRLRALGAAELAGAGQFAAAAAALACTRPGADPPDRASVDSFVRGEPASA